MHRFCEVVVAACIVIPKYLLACQQTKQTVKYRQGGHFSNLHLEFTDENPTKGCFIVSFFFPFAHQHLTYTFIYYLGTIVLNVKSK